MGSARLIVGDMAFDELDAAFTALAVSFAVVRAAYPGAARRDRAVIRRPPDLERRLGLSSVVPVGHLEVDGGLVAFAIRAVVDIGIGVQRGHGHVERAA